MLMKDTRVGMENTVRVDVASLCRETSLPTLFGRLMRQDTARMVSQAAMQPCGTRHTKPNGPQGISGRAESARRLHSVRHVDDVPLVLDYKQ